MASRGDDIVVSFVDSIAVVFMALSVNKKRLYLLIPDLVIWSGILRGEGKEQVDVKKQRCRDLRSFV